MPRLQQNFGEHRISATIGRIHCWTDTADRSNQERAREALQ
jgi:hypothetical protein